MNLNIEKMATTVQEIEAKGLAYRYIRGSHLYGTNIEGVSDVDMGGVYIADNNTLLGLPENYEPQISDEKHDKTMMMRCIVQNVLQCVNIAFKKSSTMGKKCWFKLPRKNEGIKEPQ